MKPTKTPGTLSATAHSRGGRIKRSFFFVFIALLLFNSACTSLKPTATQSDPLPLSSKVITGTLANGMRYYIQENPYPEDRVEIRLNVCTGSLNETDEEQGLAHFVEHMAFNGIRHFKHNELIAFLEDAGLTFGSHTNAYTSTDVTNYQLSLPLDRPELLEKAFLILGDWADGLLFDKGEIEKEKGVIVEEWRMRDGVSKRVGNQSRAILLAGSRYPERDPIGKMPIVKGATRDLLKGYYDANYTPDRMAVVIVGNIDAGEMKTRIEKAIGTIPAREARPAASKKVPLTQGLRVTTITDPELTSGLIATDHLFSRKPTTTYDEFKRDLTEQLAFSAFNRRIRKMITEQELPLLRAFARVTDIQSNLYTARFMSLPIKGKVNEGLESLCTEMERARRFGFLAEELTEQKAAYKRAFTRAARPERRVESSDYAADICEYDTFGSALLDRTQQLALYLRASNEITPEDLNRAFNTLLASQSRSVIFTLPEKRNAEALPKAEVESLLDRIAKKELAPYTLAPAITSLMKKQPKGGTVVSTKEMSEIDGVSVTLANGVRLIIKPTANTPGEFLIKGAAKGGLSTVSDADYKRVTMAATMVNQSGFQGIPLTEVNRLLAGRDVNISPSIGSTSASLSGGGSVKEAETLFEMLRLYFTAPEVSSKALAVQKTRLKQSIVAKAHDKKFLFKARAAEARYNKKFRDQPWQLKDLDILTPKALLADYQRFFSTPAEFTFTIVGDVNPKEMATLAALYLGGLPASGTPKAIVDRGLRQKAVSGPESIRITGEGDLAERASVTVTYEKECAFSHTKSVHLSILRRALAHRLRESVREEICGVYSISAGLRLQPIPAPLFKGSLSFTCDPERVNELIPLTESILREMGKKGITEKEFSMVIKQSLTTLAQIKKKDRFWLNTITSSVMFDWPLNQAANREALLRSADLETVNALAAETLPDIKGFITIYTPEMEDAS